MIFIPSFVDHLARYVFASERVWKKHTVDLGSKTGFGSQILSYASSKLDLVDISPDWLRQAANKTYYCPVTFTNCDFEKDFPVDTYEAAVAFEVIEHLENPEFFIKNVADHLVPGGTFVFSVPHMVANHQHKVLFNEETIKELINKYFKIEEFYIQDKKVFSGRPLYKGLKCYLGVAVKNG